MVRTKKMYL